MLAPSEGNMLPDQSRYRVPGLADRRRRQQVLQLRAVARGLLVSPGLRNAIRLSSREEIARVLGALVLNFAVGYQG